MTTQRTNNFNGLGKFSAIIVCLSISLSSCIIAPLASPTVTHVVLMWLKHSRSASDRATLIRASQSLRIIPGVLRLDAGTTPPLPPDADRTFDLAVVITFRDHVALERYERDPRHLAAVRRYLKPLVRRYVVYNLSNR